MTALFQTVLDAFKKRGWHYHVVADREVVEAAFEAHHGKVQAHIQVFGEAHLVTVVAYAGSRSPVTHRSRVAELLMRTNEELNLGGFEMRWESGEVLFRVSNVFEAGSYPEAVLAALVHAAVAETDRLNGFLGWLCQCPARDLIRVDVAGLLRREDLLPPVPEEVLEAAEADDSGTATARPMEPFRDEG